MYKIAVMGDRDSIYGFAAVGLETRPVADQAEAAIRAAIRFSDAPVQAPPLWYAIITRDGVVRC